MLGHLKKDNKSVPGYFRQKAEALLKKEKLTADLHLSETETQELIQELRLQQIERELQYDELRHAWAIAEVASEKYKELYHFAPSGYVTLSVEGNIIDINLFGSQLLGKDRSRLKHSKFGFFISDDTKPLFEHFLGKVFSSQVKEICEVSLTSDDLPPKYVHLTGIAAKSGEYCIVTIVDLTERLRMENELRESEEKYRRLFECASYGIFQSTPEGKAISVNPAFTSMFGYDSIEDALDCIKDVSTDLFADPGRRIEILRLMKENPDRRLFENAYKRKDGSAFTGILNTIPVFDPQGHLIRIEGFIEDITARKKAEEAVRESESKYRGLVENSPDAISIYVEGKIVFVNKESLRLIAANSPEDLLGKSVMQFVHPDCRSMVISRMKELTNEGTVLPLTEERFIRLDGSEVDVEVKAMSIRFENKPAVQLIIRDITKRKQAEDQLRRLNDSLEERVAERTSQLKTLNQELGFYINEMEQYSYLVSHDLQEPLRTLTNFTKLLQEEYAGRLDDNGNRYTEFIFHSADRMNELVKGLLVYSFLGKNSVRTGVDCNRVVGDVLADLAVDIVKCKANIAVKDLPLINGFPVELRLLFHNLIHNSLKFKKNEVTPEITISAENQGQHWLFRVEDNGIGIEEKDMEKIFIIFKRLHDRNEFDGTGIGLAHCKKIVELHGGRIWVEPAPAAGTSILFTVPQP